MNGTQVGTYPISPWSSNTFENSLGQSLGHFQMFNSYFSHYQRVCRIQWSVSTRLILLIWVKLKWRDWELFVCFVCSARESTALKLQPPQHQTKRWLWLPKIEGPVTGIPSIIIHHLPYLPLFCCQQGSFKDLYSSTNQWEKDISGPQAFFSTGKELDLAGSLSFRWSKV